jgi:hypothetical protein
MPGKGKKGNRGEGMSFKAIVRDRDYEVNASVSCNTHGPYGAFLYIVFGGFYKDQSVPVNPGIVELCIRESRVRQECLYTPCTEGTLHLARNLLQQTLYDFSHKGLLDLFFYTECPFCENKGKL